MESSGWNTKWLCQLLAIVQVGVRRYTGLGVGERTLNKGSDPNKRDWFQDYSIFPRRYSG